MTRRNPTATSHILSRHSERRALPLSAFLPLLLCVLCTLCVKKFLSPFHGQKVHASPRHDVRHFRRRHRLRAGQNLRRAAEPKNKIPRPRKSQFLASPPQRNSPRSWEKPPPPPRIPPGPRPPRPHLRRSRAS